MAPLSDDDEQGPSDSMDYSVAKERSRRDKRGSKASARADLLQKIKQAKESGTKYIPEVEEDNIYEEVNEDDYSDLVRKRRDENWIVEDGTGYKDDGRDLLDENHSDEDDEEFEASRKKKSGIGKKKNPNIRKPGAAPSITSMFAASTAKAKPKDKKETQQHDDLLEELLAEAGNSAIIEPPTLAVKPAVKRKQPLPLFSKRPAIRIPVKAERKPKAEPELEDSGTQSINYSQELFDESLSQNIEEAQTDDVLPSSQAIDTPPTQSSGYKSQAQRLATDISDMFDDEFSDEQMMEVDIKPPVTQDAASVKIKFEPKLDMSTSWMVNEETTKPIMSADAQTSAPITGIPTVTNSSGDQVFRFYWLDAHEDYFKHPGSIYLFGKTQTDSGSYVSCCVAVRNIYRQVFLLPREHRYDMRSKQLTDEPVTFLDVYNEFNNDVAPKFRIKNFKSKSTRRKYAFEHSDVPCETDYLEVRYSCEYPALSKDLYGETFSTVFGYNTSSLEMFLLEQKIKGPCWLDISAPQAASHSMSWCKLEILVTDFKTITLSSTPTHLSSPPLTTLTLSVKSGHNSRTNQNEVVQVACLVNAEYYVDKPPSDKLFQDHLLAVTKTTDMVFPLDLTEKLKTEGKQLKMEVFPSERALLGFLLAKIHKYDPDILIGHDISNYELDFLLNRVAANKVAHWHKISRLKRSGDIPRKSMGKSTQIDRSATCGRLICDVMISARELIRAKSYDLSELVSHVLRQKREEVDVDQLRAAYNDTRELLRVSNLTIQDAYYAHKLLFELNVLPLAWQITTICGNVLSRTLLGGRSERNEYLLLHAFTEKEFIVPDKSYGGANKDKKNAKTQSQPAGHHGDDDEDDMNTTTAATRGKRKAAYAGGLVLEPKKGFYDTFILLLDFNSLYPSIIQEYNICFTTVTSRDSADEEGDMVIPDIPDSSLPQGVLPTEIRKLVESRKAVKGLMKDKTLSKEQYMQYDIRQKALKLTANSMYGCLGFTYSRFYAKPLAALITAKGREILQKTKDLVEKQGLDVIYGDTDSIMINTNSRLIDEVFRLGNKIKAEVNKAYRLLEIDIDGVFKSMLLLKKKKYAALNMSKGPDGNYVTSQEMKGLDIVRRDWCELAKQTGEYVVSEILSGENKETIIQNIHAKLLEVKEAVNNGEIPLELYCITKQLTKAPETYPDKKSLPHVQVALRLNSSSAKQLRAGDTVYYVVCNDGSGLAASQRAYHPEEISKNDKLKVDTEYYLAHQVHPVVSRLCDPIDGTDSALIAELLGLDSSRYQHKVSAEDDEDEAHTKLLNEEEKYKHCDRLKITCIHKGCGRNIIIDSPYKPGQNKSYLYSWEWCTAMEPDGSPSHMLKLTVSDKENSTSATTSHVKNLLANAIRSHVEKYYQGWLKCEDSACQHRTRRVPLQLYRGRPVCPTCTKSALVQEYTESMLYDQLCFYKYIFDNKKKPKSLSSKMQKEMNDLYESVFDYMNARIERSEYGVVDLHKLFSKITLPGSTILSQSQIQV